MDSMKNFLRKLDEETYQVVKEEETKNLAKEDALALIADFVKKVKKDFSKREDQLSILRSAAKTMDFYIDEIETGSDMSTTSTDMGSFDSMDSTSTIGGDDEDIEMDDTEDIE